MDGAAEPERILAEADGLRILGIVETHGHADHVGALEDLVEALGVPVLAHAGDRMPVSTEPLAGEETLSVGPVDVQVLHTPATAGSLCFLANEYLFSGDTLFPAGPGNTGEDGPRSPRSCGAWTAVPTPRRHAGLPGHGLDTTIGRERPYVEVWRGRGW